MVFKLGACCVIKFSEDEKTHGKQNGFVYSTKTELDFKKKIWLEVNVRLFYDVCLWLGKAEEFGKEIFCPKSWQAYSYAKMLFCLVFIFLSSVDRKKYFHVDVYSVVTM